MALAHADTLSMQVHSLRAQWGTQFPYEDSRRVLSELERLDPALVRRCQDFIPDLDTYFYSVHSYASGASELSEWTAERLVRAQALLKRSFYQMHTKYVAIEYLVNQINAPVLYQQLSLSNQIRHLLLQIIAESLVSKSESNQVHQQQALAVLSSH